MKVYLSNPTNKKKCLAALALGIDTWRRVMLECCASALYHASEPQTILNAWRAAGISPIDRDRINKLPEVGPPSPIEQQADKRLAISNSVITSPEMVTRIRLDAKEKAEKEGEKEKKRQQRLKRKADREEEKAKKKQKKVHPTEEKTPQTPPIALEETKIVKRFKKNQKGVVQNLPQSATLHKITPRKSPKKKHPTLATSSLVFQTHTRSPTKRQSKLPMKLRS